MTKQEFAKKFRNCSTIKEAKKLYHKLALEFHPDLGGSTEDMKALVAAYEEVVLNGFATTDAEREEAAIDADLMEAIDRIAALSGLIIEVVGRWIWVDGDTFTNRDGLKVAGFRWASKKRKWYWRPADAASTNRRQMSYDEVKRLHGLKATFRTDADKRSARMLGA